MLTIRVSGTGLKTARTLLGWSLQAINTDGRDANRDGDVIIPSHIWDLLQQAIAKATGK
jgi:hypothetical protein